MKLICQFRSVKYFSVKEVVILYPTDTYYDISL